MKPIYLEPDEEITSVIDKIADLSDHRIAIVVPKNSTLFQSLINLKLLAKEAKEQGKDISIVSTNRVGQRLAQQVGFTTYNSLGTLGNEPPTKKVASPSASKPSPTPAEVIIDGVRVNQYSPDVPLEAGAALEVASVATEATELAATEESPAEADSELAAESPTPEIKSPEPTATPTAELEPVAVRPMSDEKPELTDKPTPHFNAPIKAGGGSELPPIVSRNIQLSAPKEPLVIPWKAIAVAAALVVLAFIGLYFFLPRAKVVLTLPARAVNPSQDLTVTTHAATGHDNTIAGSLLVSDQSDKKTFPATGQKDIGTTAGGTITLFNKASSSSVGLTAGTKLTASDKTFTLNKAATIPGASVSGGNVVPGQTSAEITASAGGDSYNLSGATFAIANQSSQVYGSGTTAGGTTKQVTVLSQSDIDTAVAALQTTLAGQAAEDLKSKAAKQTVLDNSSWQTIANQTIDQPVNAQVASATLSMSIEVSEIAFNQTTVTNAIEAVAAKGIKNTEELAVPSSSSVSITFKGLAEDKSAMIITTSVKGFIVQKINKTMIAKAVVHRSKNAATQILKNQYHATAVTISLTPSWWPGQLPFLSRHITVTHDFNEAAAAATK